MIKRSIKSDLPARFGKSKSLAELFQKVEKLTNILLLSTSRKELQLAFEELKCIVQGDCICDTCPEWDPDTFIVYEFARCLIPSRVFQLIKERHASTSRWKWMKKYYTSLYTTVYEDLSPHTGNMSNGDMEDQSCKYKLNKNTIKQAYSLMKSKM